VTVHWTETALADLKAIEAYIAERSQQRARSLVERVFERSGTLASFPQLGPAVPEYEDEAIREVFENPYRIIYRIEGNQIDIVAVIHAARKLPKLPPN